MLKQQIYWHTTVQMPDDSNLTPLPEKVDVAILAVDLPGSPRRGLSRSAV